MMATMSARVDGPAKCAGRATRAAAAAGWLMLLGSAAQAQEAAGPGAVDATPASAAQSLSCLQRPAGRLVFPRSLADTEGRHLVRVRLSFTRPDAPPAVELLRTTAPAATEVVRHHVAQYRLPCLTDADGTVQAVQDFDFNNSSLDPLPLPPGRSVGDACVVQPEGRPRVTRSAVPPQGVEHLVLTYEFHGDGEQPPRVKVLHSSAGARRELAAREYALATRMPCRKAGDPPQVLRQHFVFKPAGVPTYRLAEHRFTLAQFLALVRPQGLKGSFDFNTMNCPFKVHFTTYGPKLPNEVSAGYPFDPNRAIFLHWLAGQQLAFNSERQANDLFGSTVQIDVPCTRLELDGEPNVAASTRERDVPASP